MADVITELLTLSIVAEKSTSRKRIQYAKMRAGKLRKRLAEENKNETVKLDN